MFQDVIAQNKQLHWGRFERDGAPFRGASVPLIREEEADTLLTRTSDIRFGVFDVSKPEQTQFAETLATILGNVGLNWYRITQWSERWHDTPEGPKMFVFVVWVVPHMEIKPTANFGRNFINTGSK